ncbi:cation:dicarboxylate symporter family transporter [Nitratidesulfovibrio termitidis]|uniref:cation:dicarboxylate symporter family transporter n=1 Tax=Nitratidesulfovibrio termitidis TaxID=42252 RepID=UPI00316AD64C
MRQDGRCCDFSSRWQRSWCVSRISSCFTLPSACSVIFTQVGIPLEGIALVAGVDRVMDMARTTLNVLGDATGAVVVSRLEGDLTPMEEDAVTQDA